MSAETPIISPIINLGSSSGGGGSWGSITGTLSSQTDLQTALNAKSNLNFAWKDIHYSFALGSSSGAGWGAWNSNGSGYAIANYLDGFYLQQLPTSTSNTSYNNLAAVSPSSLQYALGLSPNSDPKKINFSDRNALYLEFVLGNVSDSAVTFRMDVGRSSGSSANSVGNLASNGLGIKLVGNTLNVSAYNGSYSDQSLGTVTVGNQNRLLIIANGNGTGTAYLNGTATALTGLPTGLTGSNFNIPIISVACSGAGGSSYTYFAVQKWLFGGQV